MDVVIHDLKKMRPVYFPVGRDEVIGINEMTINQRVICS